tara:strand:+ start:1815 stop:2645 length:831 start_codon:yes stop_codon:yes gene_type:complete
MSYTEIINFQETCNYINPEKDNAISMLKTCINDPKYRPVKPEINPGDFCNGEPQEQLHYQYSDSYPLENLKTNKQSALKQRDHINSLQNDLIQYLSTDSTNYLTEINNDNRIDFDGYWNTNNSIEFQETKPKFPNFVPPTKIPLENKQKELHNEEKIKKDGKIIEGFQPGDFLSDNGPGEQYIEVCPDEYEFKNGVCVKKCDHCNTNYNDSDYTDICYPYNYDGIDNFGRIMCSETQKINKNTVKVSTQLSNINSKEQLFSHHDNKTLFNINNYYI